MKKMLKEEKGDIAILFALMFTVLVGFISLAVDFGAMYYERSQMMEIGQIIRDARFTEGGPISELALNSETPGPVFLQEFSRYAALNNFHGTIEVDYKEQYLPSINTRRYSIDLTLSKEYTPVGLLTMIKSDPIPIKVKIEGSGHRAGYNIWLPSSPVNGKFSTIIP